MAAGATSFKECAPRHDVGPTAKNKVGPLLNGLNSRGSGSVAGCNYSDANKGSGTAGQLMPHGGMMMGPGGGMAMMGGPGRIGMMEMADHVEGRIAFLKAELKISEAQMPPWNAFADALRANAEMCTTMMQGGMRGQDSVSMSGSIDSITWKDDVGHARGGGTRAALALLYAVFTEEQKKVADQLIRGLIWAWVRCNHKGRSRQRLPTSIPGNDPR
jgi:hypothetical protein